MSHKGYKQTDLHRLRISEGRKGMKFSEIHKKKIGEKKKGANNYNWKGSNAGYRALHRWVQLMLGKPHICNMCGNTNLGHRCYHWANISREYKRELSDWQRLCVKCHKLFDKKTKTNI